MKKTISLIFPIVLGMIFVLAVDARQVSVKGYYRKNGTYVAPHVRNVRGSSKSSSSYRVHSYGTHSSSYDVHSYSNSSYRAPAYQQRQKQDRGTSYNWSTNQIPKEQDEVLPRVNNEENDRTVDEETKRGEVEKKKQAAETRKQEAEKRQQEAAKRYREAAETGNAKAQFNLAWCYEKGAGVKKDLDAAVRWYRKAAAQGDAAAQTALVRLGKR